jgi:hypothetical protein
MKASSCCGSTTLCSSGARTRDSGLRGGLLRSRRHAHLGGGPRRVRPACSGRRPRCRTTGDVPGRALARSALAHGARARRLPAPARGARARRRHVAPALRRRAYRERTPLRGAGSATSLPAPPFARSRR